MKRRWGTLTALRAFDDTPQSLQTSYKRIPDALDVALRREFANIISRIHRVDFSKPMDPMAMGSGGGSPYMQDLIDKVAFVRSEILGRMSLGEVMREW